MSDQLDGQNGAVTPPQNSSNTAPSYSLDDAVGDVLHQSAATIRNNLINTQGDNPDQAAQYQHLAKFVGVPVDTVYAQPDAIKTQASMQQFDADKLVTQYPKTAAYLSDPNNAATSHDDIPTLAGIEQIVGDQLLAPLKGLGGSFNQLLKATSLAVGAAPVLYDQAASVITGKENTSASDWWFSHTVAPFDANQSAFDLDPNAGIAQRVTHGLGSVAGLISQVVLSGGGGAAEMLPAAEVTVPNILRQTIGHAAETMAVPTITAGVNTGNDIIQHGGSGVDAINGAAMALLTNTLMGMAPLSLAGRTLKGFVGNLVSGAATAEASRHAMNAVLPDNMQQDFKPEDFVANSLIMSALGLTGGRPMQSVEKTVAAARATYAADQLGVLGQLSTASELHGRDPEAFRQFVSQAAEDGPIPAVYIDANTFADSLKQSNVNPADVQSLMPEVASQMQEALPANGDVRIPIEDYATHIAGGPLDEALLPHLKVDPEGMTATEAQDFYKNQVGEFSAESAKIMAQKSTDDAFVNSADEVYQNVLGQLNSTKRYPPDVSAAYATMMRDFFVTTAARDNRLPGEVYAENEQTIGAAPLVDAYNQGNGAAPLVDAYNQGNGAAPLVDAYNQGNYVDEHGFEHAGNLSPEHRATEQAFYDRIRENPQGVLNEYTDKFGNHIDSDNAKLLSPEYAADKSLASAVHEPSSRVANMLFTHLLEKNNGKPVLFTAGGGGSGKSETTPIALKSIGLTPGVVFDSTLKNYENAVKKIDQSVSAGSDVHVIYTNRHVEDAFKGSLNRDRSVPISVLADAHTRSSNVIRQLAEHYKDNPNVKVRAIDNIGLPGEAAFGNIDNVPKYEQNSVESRLYDLANQAHADGTIDSQRLAALLESRVGSAHGRSAGGVPGEEQGQDLGRPVSGARSGDGRSEQKGQEGLDPKLRQENRGAFDPATNTIALFKSADLSTFHHEAGHFFLETLAKLASRPDGAPGFKADMDKALNWFGIKDTPEQTALDRWNGMTLDEKRPYHEKFARGYEAYLMEGKAPSLALQPLFSRFKAWMMRLYKSLDELHAPLDPEIRGVYDRLLASDAQIKEAQTARGMFPLFSTKPDTMTDPEWEEYLNLNKDAQGEAESQLQARSLRDMRWLSNAKSKALKELQAKANTLRRVARIDARREVLSDPAYQAQVFLTRRMSADDKLPPPPKSDPNVLDPAHDSLFVAIAKLGGLKKDQVASEWGHTDKAASGVFGKPVLRAKGGLNIDTMAEELANHGYLSVDSNGQHDIHELEEKFGNELRGKPEYSYINDGKERVPGEGVNTEALAAGRFDRNALGEVLGRDDAGVYDELSKRGMVADNGLHPDLLSDMFGFDSGRDLAEKLAQLPSVKDAVDSRTDQLMLERHGELVGARALELGADAAVHNELRARVLATELKAISKASGPANLIARAAKDAADASIAQKRIRDLRPDQYGAAETKNAKLAEKAIRSSDLPEAVRAKRAQVLNNRLVKAATDALEEVAKGVKYLKKFDKPSKSIDLDYREQIDSLLDRYDLRSQSGPQIDRSQSLSDWVASQVDLGYEPGIPAKLLDEAARTNYKNLTMEDFRGLVDAVKNIEHLGRLKQSLLDGKEKRDFNAVVDEAVKSMRELPQRSTPEPRNPGAGGRGLDRINAKWLQGKSMLRSGDASLLKMEQMLDWLDSRKENGVFNRIVFRRLADAGVREADLKTELTAKMRALGEAMPKEAQRDLTNRYEIPELIDSKTGKPSQMLKSEILAMALNTGNESNMSKLLTGEGWSERDMWAALNRHMTKNDWDFVQGVWDTVHSLWPEIEAMERRLGNSAPEKIEARAITTPHGDYAGGYYPVIYDPLRNFDAEQNRQRSSDKLFENNYLRATTDKGHTISRNENYARPLLLSLDVITRHLNQVTHDLAYREAVMDADRFLSNSRVRQGIEGALGREYYKQLRPWLQSIANDKVYDSAGLAFWDKAAHSVRTTATMVGLGYRISTMLIHGSSALSNSVAEIGPRWMLSGMRSFSGSPAKMAETRDFVFERSGEMRNRMSRIDRDIRDALREMDAHSGPEGLARRSLNNVRRFAYYGVSMLDMASAMPTWVGAYTKALHEGMNEQDAVYSGDKAVRNSHGGGGIKDLSNVQRGSEVSKLFTMFYSYWNHFYNRQRDIGRRAASLPGSLAQGDYAGARRDFAMVLARSWFYFVIPQLLHAALKAPSQNDDDEKHWLSWAAEEIGLGLFSGIPVVRDVANSAFTGRDYQATPAASMVKSLGQTGKDISHVVSGEDVSDKWLKHAVTTSGYIFGLPTGQVANTSQFLWDISQDKQDPQDVAGWWRGVIYGDASHK